MGVDAASGQPIDHLPEVVHAELVGRILDVLIEFGPLEETAEAICRLVCEQLGYESCAILLERDGGDFLAIEGAAGLSVSYIQTVNSASPIRIHDPMLSEGPTSQAFLSGRPVTIHDVETDERFQRWRMIARRQGIRSLISIPLPARDRLIGALNCYRVEPHAYGDDEVRTLTAVAAQAGLAIQIARLVHEQQQTIGRLADLTSRLEEQTGLLEQSEKIHERMTQLVLSNQGIPSIAATLAEVVGAPVVIQDAFRHVLASTVSAITPMTGLPVYEPVSQRDLRMEMSELPVMPFRAGSVDESGLEWLVAPVVAGREVLGYVSMRLSHEHISPLIRRALGHASQVVALEVVKERLSHEKDIRARRFFAAEVLGGHHDDEEYVRSRGGFLGYDLQGRFQVLAIDIELLSGGHHADTTIEPNGFTRARQRLAEAVAQVARDLVPRVLSSESPDHIAVLVTSIHADDSAVMDIDRMVRIQMQRSETDASVSIGIGSAVASITEIRESHREALQALDIIRQLGSAERTLAFDDLGLTGILLRVTDPRELIAFARQRLGTVLEYDRAHEGILLSVVDAYFSGGQSVSVAADRLRLHPNTVRYRLRKVESLLGGALTDQSLHLDLQFALTILRIIGEPGELGDNRHRRMQHDDS